MSPQPKRRRWRLRWLVLGLYLLLLAASHAVRLFDDPRAEPGPGEETVTVSAVQGENLGGEDVRLVYRRMGPPTQAAPGVPVLLLHGSPGSLDDFRTVQPALASSYETLALDLPGFGSSTLDVPDYSIRAHAVYALQLLDELGVEKVHAVGFSMGGGVALEMARRSPERVASLSLVAAIGVQELELLGDYRLNHAVHGVQLAALWLLREGFPHFGALDGAFFGVPYARNFYDTDQRPLRQVLQEWQGPMLIVHGEYDPLVPAAAAREHARLVPQAELDLTETDHFFVFGNQGGLSGKLERFFRRVDSGEALRRAEASPERLAAAEEPFDPTSAPPFEGFTLALVIFCLAAATFVTEDFTCIAAGLLVAAGRLDLLPAVLACLAGIYVGDLGLYAAGRFLGRPALTRRPISWLVRPEDVERSSRWFDKRGPAIILATRFLPGTRLPTYFAAGLFGTRFWTFSFYFLLAAAVWTPLIVGGAAWLGTEAREVLESFESYAWVGVLAVVLLVLFVTKVLLPATTHRGRRLLRGRLRRWRRWEYWPPWIFYPPVLLWVLWLGIRHRSLTLFTAANPAMPAGGFIGESKIRILGGLAGAGDTVARWTALLPGPLEERLEQARGFMEEEGLGFPIVVKPDAGQRGTDVTVARSPGALQEKLAKDSRPLVLQEYVPGRELGVFYVRLPGEEKGSIFSTTEKRLPEVVGDGRRTLEELILADPKLLAMAPHYLRVQAAALDEIPAAGEGRRLVELGTHCRGAVFLDGRPWQTPELEEAVDRLSRAYEGFYFGRYDLRAPTLEELAQGRFKVLELNGVTSEATHIYDPANSLLEAYRVLLRQWSLAFEIGRRVVERGEGKPATLGELARAVVSYRGSLARKR